MNGSHHIFPLEISDLIGNDGDKTIYADNGILMNWRYRKRSGEHKKDSGTISISKDSRTHASFDILRSHLNKFYIHRKNFVLNFKEFSGMHLYEYIGNIFKISEQEFYQSKNK